MFSPPEIQQAATAALRKMGADIVPGKVYTHDGNIDFESAIEVEPGVYIVKMSDEICDPNNIESITVGEFFHGEPYRDTFEKEDISFEAVDDSGNYVVYINGDQMSIIVEENFSDMLSRGIWMNYVVADAYTRYVSRIQLAETIHPIDDKFLPGVCLPVVELTTEATAEGVKLTAEENERMNKAAAKGVPIIVDFNSEGIRYAMPFMMLKLETGPQYTALLGGAFGWNLACNTANEWTFLIMTTGE